MKMEQLEIALSRYEKACQKIPQSIFLADALLEEMHSKTDALLAKEFAEYLKIQEEKKEAPNGEHTED